jgi:hypothetical protein
MAQAHSKSGIAIAGSLLAVTLNCAQSVHYSTGVCLPRLDERYPTPERRTGDRIRPTTAF